RMAQHPQVRAMLERHAHDDRGVAACSVQVTAELSGLLVAHAVDEDLAGAPVLVKALRDVVSLAAEFDRKIVARAPVGEGIACHAGTCTSGSPAPMLGRACPG